MTRFAIASLMLAGSVLALLEPAHGQAVQYQFTPPPPIKTLPSSSAPSYSLTPDVAPPGPAPRQSHLAPYRVTPPPGPSGSPSTRSVQTARGRTIFVPSSPGGPSATTFPAAPTRVQPPGCAPINCPPSWVGV